MLILVTGPESSGTRFIAGALSEHPDIRGTDGGHSDPLDNHWNTGAAPDLSGNVLTRRSMPAGTGGAATFRGWPDFAPLMGAAKRRNVPVKGIITVRSPFANIVSWADRRASVAGDATKAIAQYREAYKRLLPLFDEYWLLPLEAVALDGGRAIEGMWSLLGLQPHRSNVKPRNPNEGRYDSLRL